jgi:CRP-like cAMP-binding protein
MYLTKLWYLKNIDILKCVRDENSKRLMYFTVMSRVKTNEDIYFPEQGSNHVYFVQEGHVKLSRLNDDGRPIILDVLCPGEIFGKLALESGDTANEFAEAADDVTVCVISRSNFQALLAQAPKLHFHLTKQIGNQLQGFEEKIGDLVFTDATKRVISFLVRYGHDFGRSKKRPTTIERPLSHQEISSLTGTSPQTVAMVMDELQKRKLIEFVEQSLVFHDLDRLKTLAQ